MQQNRLPKTTRKLALNPKTSNFQNEGFHLCLKDGILSKSKVQREAVEKETRNKKQEIRNVQ